MRVFICVFTPRGELCFTVLEENIASIFSMSELVQVAADVVWLQRVLGFPPCHVTTHLDQLSQLKMEAVHSSEMSEPIKHKNPKDSHYLKSNLCKNLITCGCAILRLFWNVILCRLVDDSFLPLRHIPLECLQVSALVRNMPGDYRTAWHYIQENCSLHSHNHENLRYRVM